MVPSSSIKRVSSLIRTAFLSICCTIPAVSAIGQAFLPQDLNFPDVRGEAFEPANEHPRLILVAFLSVMSERADSPSLRQSLVLSSMKRQYSAQGLYVAAIDTSSMFAHRGISRQELAKIATNWHMDFPVLDGVNGTPMGRFRGAEEDSPTLILTDGFGKIMHTWHGFTRAAYFAQAIERQVGGPLSRIPDLPPSKR